MFVNNTDFNKLQTGTSGAGGGQWKEEIRKTFLNCFDEAIGLLASKRTFDSDLGSFHATTQENLNYSYLKHRDKG